MKKQFYSLILCILASVCLSSCFSVKMVAPANTEVTLASAYEPLPIKHKVTNWYALFGSVPVSKNTKTDKIIEEMQLTTVRMETKVTFGNYIINALLNAIIPTTIVTNTTIIEGDIKK
jgi:hypothetical protein